MVLFCRDKSFCKFFYIIMKKSHIRKEYADNIYHDTQNKRCFLRTSVINCPQTDRKEVVTMIQIDLITGFNFTN